MFAFLSFLSESEKLRVEELLILCADVFSGEKGRIPGGPDWCPPPPREGK